MQWYSTAELRSSTDFQDADQNRYAKVTSNSRDLILETGYRKTASLPLLKGGCAYNDPDRHSCRTFSLFHAYAIPDDNDMHELRVSHVIYIFQNQSGQDSGVDMQ